MKCFDEQSDRLHYHLLYDWNFRLTNPGRMPIALIEHQSVVAAVFHRAKRRLVGSGKGR